MRMCSGETDLPVIGYGTVIMVIVLRDLDFVRVSVLVSFVGLWRWCWSDEGGNNGQVLVERYNSGFYVLFFYLRLPSFFEMCVFNMAGLQVLKR